MKKLKVLTIFGTRPEIIRLSRILPVLDTYFDHRMVYTQQSFDYEMSEIFFKELELRKPDYLLNVRSETLGKQLANIFSQTEEVLLKEKPDVVFVLGDTNSVLSVILAKRMHIPIFHMEAGTRCFDWEHPEEVNRVMIDHISDYNLAYSEHNRRNLIKEGLPLQEIIVTGTPMREVLEYYSEKIDMSDIIEKLKLTPHKFFVVSAHREENVMNDKRLEKLFASLEILYDTYKYPIIVTTHPRIKQRMKHVKKLHKGIRFEKPFGFFDYVKLQKNAACVLSDSGTLEEEASILGFPAIYIRHLTHRPEVYDSGAVLITGVYPEQVIQGVKVTLKQCEKNEKITPPIDYIDGNVSSKVAKIILGFGGVMKAER